MKIIQLFVLLLFLCSIPYFCIPYEQSIEEGFKNGKRRRRRHQRNHPRKHYHRRSGYRRYPYDYGYYNPFYSFYNYLGLPYIWGNPYGYKQSLNWFDYRTCPSGCVANSMSPTNFSCSPNTSSPFSCQSHIECNGCNVPILV